MEQPSDPLDSPYPDSLLIPWKRLAVDDPTTPNSSSKITTNHPSNAIPLIQNVYVHPSFSEAPKTYIDDKGHFIVPVSRDMSDPNAGTTLRTIKFGQFFHKQKIKFTVNYEVKNIGNKISVEFSSAEGANTSTSNLILAMCKYKSTLPTYNHFT
ncbi:unnamed protein product [Euphydryas editha]|uniref:Uncharacterized protein n=1 Tax=Euphydryas editha TaxID=104508 RepID=A0AAU9THK0_EUPED|nr:unnamed protein product [Euphydryas editha]